MKQKYKIFLIFWGLLLCSAATSAQGFKIKESFNSKMKIERMRSSSVYNKTFKFSDIFEYPEEIDLKSEISTNTAIAISFNSTNENHIKFTSFYFSTYGGQYFKMQIPQGAFGQDTLNVTLTYSGVSTTAQVITNITEIACKEESYDLKAGDTLEINALSNDQPSYYLDTATFEVIIPPIYGTLQKVNAKKLRYISNANTESYSTDYITYRIADDMGVYDTARTKLMIHDDPYVTKVFDFLPAPGQFVNTAWADTAAATKLIGNTSGGVSLGGYGGYVVVGFDQPIVDRDQNAYGVDFTIVGNSFGAAGGGSWTEPAAVQVSYDANKNGLPDDEWYELAGSNYYLESTEKNLTMTYYNPKYNSRKTIPYSTNKGFSGAMRTNGYHNQSYYPDPYTFDISQDSISYTGNKINFLADKSNPGYVRIMRTPIFGYADNNPANRTPTTPANPYYADENGKAADGFDLKWAVDKNGNKVDIDTAHFVKIYNPSQEDAGWLGEISPELFKVAITTPDPEYVAKDYEMHYIATTQIQVLKGTTLQNNGILFKNGIPQDGSATWTSDNTHVATIDNNGLLTALETGNTTIRFRQKEGLPGDTLNLEVVELAAIFIEIEGNIYAGSDTLYTHVGEREFINVEAAIEGTGSGSSGYGSHNRYVYESYNYETTNPEVGTIADGLFTAKANGVTKVIVQSQNRPLLKDTIVISVSEYSNIIAKSDTIDIAYTESEGIFSNSDIFQLGEGDDATDATVWIDEMTQDSSIFMMNLNGNKIYYKAKPDCYGCETVHFKVNSFGQAKEFDVVFNLVAPEYLRIPNQILFVNGGVYGSTNTSIMSYSPTTKESSVLDKNVGNATSVQDMIIDGGYAYVAADNYITRYDIGNKVATDSIYTQDTDSAKADGLGTAGNGLNNKMATYQNLLLVTRQNSNDPPQDGYNVRVYNKGDLSLVTKIPVSDQASDIVVKDDKAYVIINGGYSGTKSSMAIINLNTLTLEKEVDLAKEGLGVTQLVVVNNKIIGARNSDYYFTYDASVFVYDITSETCFNKATGSMGFSSAPLIIEPLSNDTSLFVRYNNSYISYNYNDSTLDYTEIMTSPISSLDPMGSSFDPIDSLYYITFAGWVGEGMGVIFNTNFDSVGTFEGVKEAPECLAITGELEGNNAPYLYSHNTPESYNEDASISYKVKYYAFKDNVSTRPAIYMKNPAQYDWLTYDPKFKYIKGKYTGEVLEPTTFDIVLQGMDEYGAWALDTVKITINPVDDAPTVANELPNITVVENSLISPISLDSVFTDIDNADSLITKEIESANDSSLFTLEIVDGQLLITLLKDSVGQQNITIKGTSNGKSVSTTFTIVVRPTTDAPVVANPIEDITVDEDATIASLALTNVFTTGNNDIVALSIVSENDESLLTINLENDSISFDLKENQFGQLQVVIAAKANNLTVTDTFTISVNAVDDPVTLAQAIADINIDEDAKITPIVLSGLFTDIDNDIITKSIISTNDESLVTLSIVNDTLNIELKENQNGILDVVLQGEAGSTSATDTFTITVNAVNDAPIVADSIVDMSVDMNDDDVLISLKNIFEDVDSETLTLTVSENSNATLVNTSIKDDTLTLSFTEDQFGDARITLKASDETDYVTTSFNITVKNTSAITLVNAFEVKMYPNPTSDMLTIQSAEKLNSIKLYNTSGMCMNIASVQNKANTYMLDLNDLPAGVYFVSISANDKTVTKSVIKE